MDTPKYTKKDMMRLAEMCEKTSPMLMLLEDVDYNPKELKKALEEHGLKSHIKFLFETPLEDIPLLLEKKEVEGYIAFRLDIGK